MNCHSYDEPRVRRARWVLGAWTAVATLLGSAAFAASVGANGFSAWDVCGVGLFAVLFGWIAFGFGTATLGLFSVLREPPAPAAFPPLTPEERGTLPSTAVLMPVYNESPDEVVAGVRAMLEDLRNAGAGGLFDLFLLSDSTDPEVWLAEERAWAKLNAELPAGENVFYRHRPKNTARKAGNIADFCCRWGTDYEVMIPLDADSVVDAATLIELARRMRDDVRIGILQAPPRPVGKRSTLARWQQFCASLYGPVFLRGFALWSGSDGNYWGHNAAIRVAPFRDHCDLPKLPGTAPMGGEILSHDFVEAALMRRAGLKVCLATDLTGSYESCPTTLRDFAVRDQRWCQGNMQHARLLSADRLHPLSRLHLASGVMGYCAAPLWLLFLLTGTVAAAVGGAGGLLHVADPTAPWGPLAFAAAMGMLLLPKLYGVATAARTPGAIAAHGGWAAVLGGVLLETALSVLVAPVMMLFHSRFVATTLAGRTVKWNAQDRGDREVSAAEAWAVHWPHVLLAAAALPAVWYFAPAMLGWLLPVLLGPLLAVPLAVWLGSSSAGRWLARRDLWRIPEEADPPPVLRRHAELLATGSDSAVLPPRDDLHRPPAFVDDGSLFAEVLRDPGFFALHSELLARTGGDVPLPRPDRVRLARAYRRTGPAAVAPADRRALLGDRKALADLHAWTRVNAV